MAHSYDHNQSGDATGGPEIPIQKPMDKPAKKYTANETVPPDNFHEEPLSESLMDNPAASRNP